MSQPRDASGLSVTSDQIAGLYIHVPFCSGKCPYCDFYSLAAPGLQAGWLEALDIEAGLYTDDIEWFDTLYLGGGTPSRLTKKQVNRLMDCISRFRFAPEIEVTIEANPEDVTPEWVTHAREVGVNRWSLGVQSFNDRELGFLGRRHTVADVVRAIETIRAAGGSNLSLDLIYGLPDQPMENWRRTLQKALSYGPEHLSCYQLTVEKGVRFADLRAKGKLHLPDEDVARAFFLTTRQFLEDNGYIQYEVSSFARGLEHRSRHNRKYWRRQPYLGLGPSAHSHVGGRRWWNHRSLERYRRALSSGQRPWADHETLASEQVELETIFLGLRTMDGLDLSQALGRPRGETIIGQWREDGLAEIIDNRLVLTKEGLVLADRLALELSG